MSGTFSLAVHALVYLDHMNTHLSSEALAENICTNPARVRKVMALLKRAGLVSTKEGFEGGYTFCSDAGHLTLAQVAQAVGVCFVEVGWRSGNEDMECLVASGMARVMDGIYAELNGQCLAHLDHITIGDIERSIFDQQLNEGKK